METTGIIGVIWGLYGGYIGVFLTWRPLGVLDIGFTRGLWGIRRPWGACWMVAEGGEGENPLPFSLTAPKRGGGGGGGGVGGVPASFPSRSPPPKLVGRAPSPGGPGPKPPGDLAHRPLGPGSRHSH